ncbi:MAG: hypothetical protein ABFS18_07775 [Thermodesulfobacteriota bacterium]
MKNKALADKKALMAQPCQVANFTLTTYDTVRCPCRISQFAFTANQHKL